MTQLARRPNFNLAHAAVHSVIGLALLQYGSSSEENPPALLIATQQIIDETRVDQRFTAGEIRRMHQLWLGEIYEWAGEYRGVNIAKGAFMFAAAIQIPRLMRDLESGPLGEYTPCSFNTTAAQASALAIVHTELILIHPFRDGNGRCARLLAVLMGYRPGYRLWISEESEAPRNENTLPPFMLD